MFIEPFILTLFKPSYTLYVTTANKLWRINEFVKSSVVIRSNTMVFQDDCQILVNTGIENWTKTTI